MATVPTGDPVVEDGDESEPGPAYHALGRLRSDLTWKAWLTEYLSRDDFFLWIRERVAKKLELPPPPPDPALLA
jgi:hypothetical protein